VAGKQLGPYLFYDMVNSECYMKNILEPFFKMLSEEEKQYAYF
jgi:hypothetical protein